LPLTGRIAYDLIDNAFAYEAPRISTDIQALPDGLPQPVDVDYEAETLQPTWSHDGQRLLLSVYTDDIPGRPVLTDAEWRQPAGTQPTCPRWLAQLLRLDAE
jgi:hypothetical protein